MPPRPSPLAEPLRPRRHAARRRRARHDDGQPRRPPAPTPTARSAPARWRSRAWICCRLAFRGRHRTVMGAGYTEIFFLDEATALAAGHRPVLRMPPRRRPRLRRALAARRGRAAAGTRDGPRPPRRAPRPPETGRLRQPARGRDLRRRRRLPSPRRPRAHLELRGLPAGPGLRAGCAGDRHHARRRSAPCSPPATAPRSTRARPPSAARGRAPGPTCRRSRRRRGRGRSGRAAARPPRGTPAAPRRRRGSARSCRRCQTRAPTERG